LFDAPEPQNEGGNLTETAWLTRMIHWFSS